MAITGTTGRVPGDRNRGKSDMNPATSRSQSEIRPVPSRLDIVLTAAPTAMQAIGLKCFDCCGAEWVEVKKCEIDDCALWRLRLAAMRHGRKFDPMVYRPPSARGRHLKPARRGNGG